jgi:hypothetical protein
MGQFGQRPVFAFDPGMKKKRTQQNPYFSQKKIKKSKILSPRSKNAIPFHPPPNTLKPLAGHGPSGAAPSFPGPSSPRRPLSRTSQFHPHQIDAAGHDSPTGGTAQLRQWRRGRLARR